MIANMTLILKCRFPLSTKPVNHKANSWLYITIYKNVITANIPFIIKYLMEHHLTMFTSEILMCFVVLQGQLLNLCSKLVIPWTACNT